MPSVESATPEADDARLRERDAFRELHGRRLHGFALLLTLGDRAQSARLAGQALADGGDRVEALRHPERAAAWLRARVRSRMRARPVRWRGGSAAAAAVLSDLGVERTTVAGLASLDPRTRAAVIARTVEGFDLRDVATIVGRDGRRLDRLLGRGLHRYAAAAAAAGPSETPDGGPLARRLEETVRRAIA